MKLAESSLAHRAEPAYPSRVKSLLPFTLAVLLGALRAGAQSATPLQHVIVIMQENRSFDHYFGRLARPEWYGKFDPVENPNGVTGLDGDEVNGQVPTTFIVSPRHITFFAYHAPLLNRASPGHDWYSMHAFWNHGRNNLFGPSSMGYYTGEDLPYYYALANTFAISDSHFASVLGPTYPNRFYILCGTSFGRVSNRKPPRGSVGWTQKTIFDLCDEHGVTWAYYFHRHDYLRFFAGNSNAGTRKRPLTAFSTDLQADALPQVVFIEGDNDEHPRLNPQVGQHEVAQRIAELTSSTAWNSSACFLTYDEGGGFYDHVAPPAAVAPDSIPPDVGRGGYLFDRLGFRVPLVIISPFARRHYVSHQTTDHTSILAFIETVFGLPPLTARDAAAGNFLDAFDFENPDFTVPTLPEALITAP